MKKLAATLLTLTAIGVAVKVVKEVKEVKINRVITLGHVNAYPTWVRNELLKVNC